MGERTAIDYLISAVAESAQTLRTLPGGWLAEAPCVVADELARIYQAGGWTETYQWVMFEHRAKEGDHTCIEDQRFVPVRDGLKLI